MNKEQYISLHKDQYLGWAGALSLVTDKLRLMEFAVLSAHTSFDRSLRAWQAIESIDNEGSMRGVLASWGVLPTRKAEYIMLMRQERPLPVSPYSYWREDVKVMGLGMCKASFAACLVDPLHSDVVCLDTWMAKAYDTTQQALRRPSHYKRVEEEVIREATKAGMPPFAYQWAVWDFTRGKMENHAELYTA